MKFLGVDFDVEHMTMLDKDFLPLGAFMDGYLKGARQAVTFAVARPDGTVSAYDTFLYGTPVMRSADEFFASRLIKMLLWIRGGVEVHVFGNDNMAAFLQKEYSERGNRAFDAQFMSRVYERPFVVKAVGQKPISRENPMPIGGHFDGCRIGFDAGGSDRKVSAVIDGQAVYSEEVVWRPKSNANPDYHFQGIVSAFKIAASKMPRVDAIGVSSAGIYVDNRTMVASLFLKVPPMLFDQKVKDIYIRAAGEIGDVPLVVANDGDVAALAGAMELGEGRVLGLAMGTSEAVGYVDINRYVTGWLNELAFVPVDCNPNALADEWSGDVGCGVKYFSQDGVIKLAALAGIELDAGLTPAQKLKVVQDLMEVNDSRASAIYRDIGVYFAHAVNLYARFYDIGHILLLGRVVSGSGGNLILQTAQNILAQEYPALAEQIRLALPDERNRRVGQSVAAAGLPQRFASILREN